MFIDQARPQEMDVLRRAQSSDFVSDLQAMSVSLPIPV